MAGRNEIDIAVWAQRCKIFRHRVSIRKQAKQREAEAGVADGVGAVEEAEVAIRRVNKLLQGLSLISMVSKPQLSKRMLVSQKAGAGGVGAEANEVDGLCLTYREAAEVAGVIEEVNLA